MIIQKNRVCLDSLVRFKFIETSGVPALFRIVVYALCYSVRKLLRLIYIEKRWLYVNWSLIGNKTFKWTLHNSDHVILEPVLVLNVCRGQTWLKLINTSNVPARCHTLIVGVGLLPHDFGQLLSLSHCDFFWNHRHICGLLEPVLGPRTPCE